MFEATRSVSGRVVRVRPVDSAGALDAGAPPADDVDGSFVVLVDVLVDDADDSESSAQARAPRAAFDEVSVLLCTVTFYANLAHNLTRSP